MTLAVSIVDRANSAQSYAQFDPATLPATMALSSGNMVTTALASATVRAIRSDLSIPLSGSPSKPYRAAFYVWGGNGSIPAGGGTAPTICIGLCNASANLNNAIGSDANGIAIRLAAGGVTAGVLYNNSLDTTTGVVGDITKFTTGAWIFVVFDQSFPSLDVTVYYGNGQKTTVHRSIPFTGPIYLAVSSNADASGNIVNPVNIMMNSGYWDMTVPGVSAYPPETAPGVGTIPFWVTPRTPISPIYFSDHGYNTGPSAVGIASNLDFPSRIMNGGTVRIDAGVTFYPWGNATPAKTNVSLQVSNGDGMFDNLVIKDVRDAAVIFNSPVVGTSWSLTYTAALVLNAVAPQSDAVMTIGAMNSLIQLDANLSRRLLPPDADAASTSPGRCWPVLLGSVFSVNPTLISSALLKYGLAGDDLSGIMLMRDKGYPLNPLAGTPDYARNADGTYTLHAVSAGTLTADVGPANVALSWNGATATASSTFDAAHPPARAINGDHTALNWGTGNVAGAGWNSNLISTSEWLAVAFAKPQNINRIVVYTLPDNYTTFAEPTDTTSATSFGVKDYIVEVSTNGGSSYSTVATITGNALAKRVHDFTTRLGVTNVRITVTASWDGYARVVELEAYTNAPRSLDDFVADLLKYRAPQGAIAYSSSDLTAIATAAGYAGPIGYYAADPTKINEPLGLLMQSYHAGMWFDGSNGTPTARFFRLVAPELGTATGTPLSLANIIGDLVPATDYAPNLTTRAVGGKNYTQLTEFSTDVSVTPAVRNTLSRQFRFERGYSGPLADMYTSARTREPMETILQLGDDVQKFIDYLCAMYKIPRMFATVTVKTSDAPTMGQIVLLTYPRYGLGGGKNALVVGRTDDLITGQSTVRLWCAGG